MRRYHISPKTGRPNICRAEPGNCPLGENEVHYYSKEAAKMGAEKILAENNNVLSSNSSKNNTIIVKDKVNDIAHDLVNNIAGGDNRSFNIYSYALRKLNEYEDSASVKNWRAHEIQSATALDTIFNATRNEPFSVEKLEELKQVHADIKIYGNKNNHRIMSSYPYSERCEHMSTMGEYALKEWAYKNNKVDYSKIPRREDASSLIGLNDAVYNTISHEEDVSASISRGKYESGRKLTEDDVNDVLDYIHAHGNTGVIIPGYERENKFDGQEDRYVFEARDVLRDEIYHNNSLYMRTVFPERELKTRMDEIGIQNVSVSPLNNGREVGLSYTVFTPDGNTRTFSVYEHRNTDSIIINGKTNVGPGELPYASESKEAFFAEFAPEDRKEAADALCYFMSQAQRGQLEDDKTLVTKSNRRDWGNILSETLPGFKEFAEKNNIPIRKKPKTDEEILDQLDFNLNYDFDD